MKKSLNYLDIFCYHESDNKEFKDIILINTEIQVVKFKEIEDFSKIPFKIDDEENEIFFAFDKDNFLGYLKGCFITEKLFYIIEIEIQEKNLVAEIHNAFANYLSTEFKPLDIEILSWDKPEQEIINNHLEKSGFKVSKKKVFVEKELKDYVIPYKNQLCFKSLSEVGEKYFIEMMSQAAIGDPFEENTDPEKGFQELVDYAGEKFNADWWKIVYLNDSAVGVVLPQTFAYGEDEGTLFYLGVIPEYRGKGLGKIIHAFGLEFLSKNGVLKYKGSTDIENKSMIEIFNKNGCIQTGTQIIYSLNQAN